MYDFTTLTDRRGRNTLSVDYLGVNPGFTPDPPKEGYSLIPMWVADMNFDTCPKVIEMMEERLKHPLYGYFRLDTDYYNAVIRWHKERKGVKELERKHIGYENGVVGGVISALKTLCKENRKVLIHSPKYSGFNDPFAANGFEMVFTDLVMGDDGLFHMDYCDMEKKIVENDIKVMVLTSPQNPSGRVWTMEELVKLSDLLEKYSIKLVCDQIWSDILLNGNRHIPVETATEYLKENTIAFYAPSKTFSLAGLIGAYHVVYNDELHRELKEVSEATAYNEPNIFATAALLGAYSDEGMAWADELMEVLSGNVNYAYDFTVKNFKGVKTVKPQGTYLLYLDCEDFIKEKGITLDDLLKAGWDVGVAWQDGRPFGGNYHVRLNLALPKAYVEEAFERLKEYVFR